LVAAQAPARGLRVHIAWLLSNLPRRLPPRAPLGSSLPHTFWQAAGVVDGRPSPFALLGLDHCPAPRTPRCLMYILPSDAACHFPQRHHHACHTPAADAPPYYACAAMGSPLPSRNHWLINTACCAPRHRPPQRTHHHTPALPLPHIVAFARLQHYTLHRCWCCCRRFCPATLTTSCAVFPTFHQDRTTFLWPSCFAFSSLGSCSHAAFPHITAAACLTLPHLPAYGLPHVYSACLYHCSTCICARAFDVAGSRALARWFVRPPTPPPLPTFLFPRSYCADYALPTERLP